MPRSKKPPRRSTAKRSQSVLASKPATRTRLLKLVEAALDQLAEESTPAAERAKDFLRQAMYER
jgi:hypothetical protein